MREYLTVLTRKGQITVPAGVRRVLGLKVGDKVAVLADGTDVRIAPATSVIARTAGAVASALPPLSSAELRAAAEEVWAAEAMECGGDTF